MVGAGEFLKQVKRESLISASERYEFNEEGHIVNIHSYYIPLKKIFIKYFMREISKQELIVFTASCIVLLALGIDIMLPAFGEVRRHFGLPQDSILTSNIVAFFFMGQITQIFFGYLTDRIGRLPVIRLGILFYIICGVAVVYAPIIELMFLFRFLAGVGAAAVVMTAVASVRDRFAGDDMAKIMSFVFS
ncbi:MAG TPA: MFS transporter, partial [Saprospiraceae bacterium]|nr:MFS transporter [Saprospiraceae bacterium]